MSRHLYLPIEIGSRELASKTLVASVAAEAGYNVVIGFQHTLFFNAGKLPPGVFLSKSSNNAFLQSVRGLGQSGHLVVASEEEHFGYCSADALISNTSQFLKGRCDLYLCIGNDEAAYMKQRFGSDFPLVVTGNARTDLLRPRLRGLYAQDAADVRQQNGKFILFNTNFGLTNPVNRQDLKHFFLLWAQLGLFQSDGQLENRKHFDAFVAHERANQQLVRELLKMLAKYPEIPVIVRPHPVEYAETWTLYVRELDASHIKVAPRTAHVPFMLASELTVHPGCTTGMEALALGVPALSLVGDDQSPLNAAWVSNVVNPTETTAVEALATIKNHWSGGDKIRSQQEALRKKLDHYLADASADTLSAEKIVDACTKLLDTNERHLPKDSRRVATVRWQADPAAQNKYFAEKYGVTDQSLKDTLASLGAALNRFGDVRIKKLFADAYLIERAT